MNKFLCIVCIAAALAGGSIAVAESYYQQNEIGEIVAIRVLGGVVSLSIGCGLIVVALLIGVIFFRVGATDELGSGTIINVHPGGVLNILADEKPAQIDYHQQY